jgi:hypothetical protein
MWLNRGELARAKRHTARAAPHRVRRVASALAGTATWARVSNLDAATYDADAPPADDDQSPWSTWLRTAGPWAALTVLLRLFLRR